MINFNLSNDIFLHDKVQNTYHDIKNSTYTVNLPAGVNSTQFEVVFKDGNALNTNTEIADSFQVFQNNDQQLLTVFNSLKLDLSSLSLYDVTGKRVINKLNLGSSEQYEIPTSGLSDGIYIVKLNTVDNVTVDKKVSIFRN